MTKQLWTGPAAMMLRTSTAAQAAPRRDAALSLTSRRRAAGEALFTAARRHVVLDCATAQGRSADLAAANIRTVLVDRADEVSRFGVRISNARITGQLDLSACRVDFPIYFRDCQFTEPLLLEGSALHSLALVGMLPSEE